MSFGSIKFDASKNKEAYSHCYKGQISRNEADEILNELRSKNGADGEKAVGRFLVRTSAKLDNHIIISVLGAEKIYHYPIRININGTFSVNNETFMNLNDLIRHCQNNENNALNVKLTMNVDGDPLPMEMRRIGSNTILHKTVQSGTEDMMRSELEKTECPKLTTKNEDGNTPLHIAAYMNRDSMVDLLMTHNASIEQVNTYGWNALHLAALGNNPSTIYLLCVKWKADIESRNPLNMFTALHCAAACNNVEAMKMLCILGADRQATNDAGMIPIEVANNFASEDALLVLLEESNDPLYLNKDEWFVGNYPYNEQMEFENRLEPEEGQFFVRCSLSRHDGYTMCVCLNQRWIRLMIDKQKSGKYMIGGDDQEYSSLEAAVNNLYEHYRYMLYPVSADKIKSKLKMSRSPSAVNGLLLVSTSPQLLTSMKQTRSLEDLHRINDKSSKDTLNLSSLNLFRRRPSRKQSDPYEEAVKSSLHSQRAFPVKKRNVRGGELGFVFNHQTSSTQQHDKSAQVLPTKRRSTIDFKGSLTGSMNSLRSRARLIPTISASQIEIGNLLGEGNYGYVYSGLFVDKRFFTHAVAVKVLKNTLEGTLRNEFLAEASVMRKLTHPFIVRLYGIVANKRNLWMIQELIPHGSLHTYLRLHKRDDLNGQIRLWTVQLADAMKYMEAKHVIHRDLAARNILLSSSDRIKVADFGLARYTGNSSSNLYVQTSSQAIPIAWYAPEAYTYYTFTNKSDVWSFGVTIWEMYSGGERPYSQIDGNPMSILSYILSNYRLAKPDKCSDSTWTLIYTCWNINADYRPTFSTIYQSLSGMSEYYSAVRQTQKLSIVFK